MKAALATAASPPVRASSNLRRKVRTRERRFFFSSGGGSILRIAFLAPGLLAIETSNVRPGRKARRGQNRRRGYTGRAPLGQRVLGDARTGVSPASPWPSGRSPSPWRL